ncbi:hypothetical protein [Candidatus Methylomicrobium oryzae]|jgi:hypothetical protein|uniref:hypothetical protein n=1 Tax=Candidatus Methylomicrobium oryzae TaxID=2802053 RepID=UPI0019231DBB|nr:hypothetical protein [Methylomicrobium sp. RS1]MBL1264876.1 hypothetical protein [Methylomicrobium sp. RS1]
MNSFFFRKILRIALILLLALPLAGCIYWWRAYQTYLQMSEFDRYFKVAVADDFTLQFKEPILYSDDFVSLAKLHASEEKPTSDGKRWRYWFRKVDQQGKVIKPKIEFYSDLNFNRQDRITAWSFSSLFLEIAPPKLLEVSLRSIGGADINKEKMQLKADTSRLGKINVNLPLKSKVVEKLGEPLRINDDHDQDIYVYHFKLITHGIEEGYEDRELTTLNLSFDKKTQELTKMSGRFAGLKISINYGNLVGKAPSGIVASN